MATIQQLEEGIRRADAAGDTNGVRVLGQQLMAMRQQPVAKPTRPSVATTTARGIANGVTAGFMDKIAAGLDSVIPLDKLTNPNVKSIWETGDLGSAYRNNLALQRGETAANRTAHPAANIAGEVGGAVVSPVNKVAAPLQALGMTGRLARVAATVAPDAAYGLLYGAGQSDASTYGGQAKDALKSAAGSVAGGIAGRGVVKAASRVISPLLARGVVTAAPGSYKAATQLLANEGVDIMPGQALGPGFKRTEEKLMSAPLLGDAITRRSGQQMNQFQTAALNRALKPLGETMPAGKTGTEAMGHAQQVFNDAYDKARAGLVFQTSPEFGNNLADLMDRAQNSPLLSADHVARLQKVVSDLQTRRIAPNGTMSGDVLKRTLSSLKSDAAKLSSGNNSADNQALGGFMHELVDHIDEAARTNPASDPAAVKLMDNADQGYAILTRLENAAKMRGGEAGAFSPAQLDAAVQRADKTARNRAYSRGDALLQDLATAGKQVLAPKVPNSGTTDRAMLLHMLGRGALNAGTIGTGAAFSPLSLLAPAAASTPYLIPKLLTKRPDLLLRAGEQLGNRSYVGGALGAPAGALLLAPRQ